MIFINNIMQIGHIPPFVCRIVAADLTAFRSDNPASSARVTRK